MNIKEECLIELKENYNNPSHPLAFSGISNIYNYFNGVLSVKDIENFLASNEGYTIHREYKNLKRNPSFARFKRYQFQIDLVDIRHLKEYNDGVSYLFNAIDSFSRYAFSRGIKNKSADSTLSAFKSILSEAKTKPLTLISDRGSEITNKKFLSFCKENDIKVIHNYTSVHAAFVERFNRTLQKLVYTYMTENETFRFIDVLQLLVKSYNNKMHRMIQMTPSDAEKKENSLLVQDILQKYYNTFTKRKPKFYKGQLVRIAKQKGKFSRGYKDQSNAEIFRIKSIKTSLPIPLYNLEEYDKSEIILGGFYAHEITPVTNEVFRIEKIIKSKTTNGNKQHYVKWKGFPLKYNSWVSQKELHKFKHV